MDLQRMLVLSCLPFFAACATPMGPAQGNYDVSNDMALQAAQTTAQQVQNGQILVQQAVMLQQQLLINQIMLNSFPPVPTP